MVIDGILKNNVIELIQAGEEREARSLLIDRLGLPGKDADRLVDAIKADLIKDKRLHTVKSLKRREEIKATKGCFKFIGGAVFVGAALISLAFYLEFNRVKKIENSDKIYAIVIDNSNPIILSYTINNQEFYYEFSNSSNDGYYIEVGGQVEIYVNKNEPNDAIVNSDHHLWSSSRALKVIGAVPLALGFLLFVIMLLPDKKKN